MKNNKIRYKSMKRSSPLAQYRRFLLGQHHQNWKRHSTKMASFPIPNALAEQIRKSFGEYQNAWVRIESRKTRSETILEREKYDKESI